MRGNIVVKQNTRSIWLYTRKLGMVLPEILKSALIRGKGSWGDTATLTHIIYSEMLASHMKDEKGFGISTYMQDNGCMIWAIDDQREIVGFFYESGRLGKAWSFSDFVNIEDTDLMLLTDNMSVFDYSEGDPATPIPHFPENITLQTV